MKIKCQACQFENPADTRFCSNCGKPLQMADDIHFAKTLTLDTTVTELERGTVFANRYEVIEELGKGGMGSVYRVLDKKINEEVALKLIRPEIVDERTLERFSNELKYTRRIAHRNVCKMYDLGEDKGTHFITMEYIPGEDLKSMIKMTRQLGVRTSVFIAKQICEGLAEAHGHGIVHRDLKPSNIIIDKEGNARIMDFGIARSLRRCRKTSAGVLVGTPEYMSPEQAEAKEADQRSDFYSLGVILFEMLTGRVPFGGEDPLGVVVKHKLEKPPVPKRYNPDIPDDLNRLILKCLEKDKESRYQTAEELFRDLVQIEKNAPTTHHGAQKRKPITTREITVKFNMRKLALPAFLLLAIIVMGVVGWRYFFGQSGGISPENMVSIAVISFENQTGDTAYDYLQDAIPNLLITSLEQAKSFRVTSWERVRDLLEQLGRKDVSVIDRDLGFELCRLDDIQAIILGSFTKAENMFATDVKVLDVETKSLLKSVSSRGEGVDSIIKKQIDELSKEIRQEVGISSFLPKIGGSNITDVNIFDIFSIPLVVGNPRTALAEPNCAIISEKTAKKYWGDSYPLNKIIVLTNIQTHNNDDNFISFRITGVFKELPANTHFHADIIGSYTSFEQGRSPKWKNISCLTYFKMKNGTNVRELETKIQALILRHSSQELEKLMEKEQAQSILCKRGKSCLKVI